MDSGAQPSHSNDEDDGEIDLLPSKIYLIDRSVPLVEEWKTAFSRFRAVEAIAGDYFQRDADAIVSPANSFGIMDGGIDAAIREQLGWPTEREVQRIIVEKYHGELPVGAAEIVQTRHPRWKYLISAATMRVPGRVVGTLNAYLAFRAILVAVENLNRAALAAGAKKCEIDSLVCCGLCTGFGGFSPQTCAGQMRLAYKSVLLPSLIPTFDSIHRFHAELYSV